MNSGGNKTALLIAIWVMMGLISMGAGIASVKAGMEPDLGGGLPKSVHLRARSKSRGF